METLLSVGIDIGTTTTQLVISRLTLQNTRSAFSVPSFEIAQKEVLFRSDIHFTPLLSDTQIDAQGVRDIVEAEYRASGFEKSDIQTGAVIITGETARKDNARQVLDALAGFAGDFVVATAGPALESVLAGKGAGAEAYSRTHGCSVLNLDIGGGTTNLALFENGELRDTGCLNVGGRLVKVDASERLTYLSPVLQPFFDLSVGQKMTEALLEPVAQLLAEVLEEAVGLRKPSGLLEQFITDKNVTLPKMPLLSFSGGVADLISEEARPPFVYGDLGVLLGRAICRSRLCTGAFLRAQETIRATVIGAGSHATTLSGSTIFYDGVSFPMKNLPVAALSPEDEALEPEELARRIRQKKAIVCPDGERSVLALQGRQSPRFSELCRLADGIALGLQSTAPPYIIAVRSDMGKALGQALGTLMPDTGLICLDGVSLRDGAYLDIGAPVANGQALPVVIKTLVL